MDCTSVYEAEGSSPGVIECGGWNIYFFLQQNMMVSIVGKISF
jgi:hypothetical protein